MQFIKIQPAYILIALMLAMLVLFIVFKGSIRQLGGGNEKSVILYYAPWCGHCKNLMPEWNKFQEAGVDGVEIKKINSDTEKDAVKAAGVSGFPTIIKYNNGKKEVYAGDRTAEALKGWAAAN